MTGLGGGPAATTSAREHDRFLPGENVKGVAALVCKYRCQGGDATWARVNARTAGAARAQKFAANQTRPANPRPGPTVSQHGCKRNSGPRSSRRPLELLAGARNLGEKPHCRMHRRQTGSRGPLALDVETLPDGVETVVPQAVFARRLVSQLIPVGAERVSVEGRLDVGFGPFHARDQMELRPEAAPLTCVDFAVCKWMLQRACAGVC